MVLEEYDLTKLALFFGGVGAGVTTLVIVLILVLAPPVPSGVSAGVYDEQTGVSGTPGGAAQTGQGQELITGECNVDDHCSDDEECVNSVCTALECEFCEYVSNHQCVSYECCNNIMCEDDEECDNSLLQCVSLDCGFCEHAQNHTCIAYECCNDDMCGNDEYCSSINQTCQELVCDEGLAVDHRCQLIIEFESINITPLNVEQFESVNININISSLNAVNNVWVELNYEDITSLVNVTEETNNYFSTIYYPSAPGSFNITVFAMDSQNFIANESYGVLNVGDVSGPYFNALITENVYKYSRANISISNINDLSGVSKVWVNITDPDDDVNINFLSLINNTAKYSFNATLEGIYNVLVLANDTLGNVNSFFANVSVTERPVSILLSIDPSAPIQFSNATINALIAEGSFDDVNGNITWNDNTMNLNFSGSGQSKDADYFFNKWGLHTVEVSANTTDGRQGYSSLSFDVAPYPLSLIIPDFISDYEYVQYQNITLYAQAGGSFYDSLNVYANISFPDDTFIFSLMNYNSSADYYYLEFNATQKNNYQATIIINTTDSRTNSSNIDFDVTWNPPVLLPSVLYSLEPSFAYDDGVLHYSFVSVSSKIDILYANSTDSGDSWSSFYNITSNPDLEVRNYLEPELLGLTYISNYSDNYDVFYRRINTSFTPVRLTYSALNETAAETIVTNDNKLFSVYIRDQKVYSRLFNIDNASPLNDETQLFGSQNSFSDISLIQDDDYYELLLTNRSQGSSNIYLSRSADGINWETPYKINSSGFNNCTYPVLFYDGFDYYHIAFKCNRTYSVGNYSFKESELCYFFTDDINSLKTPRCIPLTSRIILPTITRTLEGNLLLGFATTDFNNGFFTR